MTDRAAAPRFAFGRNWRRFLEVLDDARIEEAERSLSGMLGRASLHGATFIDVGSGSGLFSLAAARLGAARVHSFDYDLDSVACTTQLRDRFGPAEAWTVERGSALDEAYIERLGQWDVVYSWGVLHHTGNMWQALDNVTRLVTPGGLLFISIYNDQGPISDGWKAVKRTYNRSLIGRGAVLAAFVPDFVGRGVVVDLLRRRNPFARYREYQRTRGMSATHDWIDWLGGYPFEVARPEAVFDFFQARGFELRRSTTCGGRLGCNEFVFSRAGQARYSMNRDLCALLACPECRQRLLLEPGPPLDGEIESGTLTRTRLRRHVPGHRRIPRFVPADNYSKSFGFQWNRFRRTQLDSFTGQPISRERFFAQSGWREADLDGARVLDLGCGAGRFAEIALGAGARLVAVDYSSAVDACRANLGPHPRLDVVQGDVYRLPFQAHQFDFVYCFGVLQHTPDVKQAFMALTRQVAAGGRLSVDAYPRIALNLLLAQVLAPAPRGVCRPTASSAWSLAWWTCCGPSAWRWAGFPLPAAACATSCRSPTTRDSCR